MLPDGPLLPAAGPWDTVLDTLRDRPPAVPLFFASWARIEPARGRYDDAMLDTMRATLRAARALGHRPWVCLHAGALPGWQRDRGGWEDPDARAAWSCYVERTGAALGGMVAGWTSVWRPLREADAHGPRARVAGRALLDAMAIAYLHLRRGSAAGTGAPVAVAEAWGAPTGGRIVAGALRARLLDARADALIAVLRTGRLRLPWAPFGELPNGTPALDALIALGHPGPRAQAWRAEGLLVATAGERDTFGWVEST